MLIPVLNKESTAQELDRLCWLLNEIKTTCCDDVNLCWKLAQLAYKAEELYEKFLDENNLFSQSSPAYQGEYFEKLPAKDRTEAMLSSAFQSAAVMDSARFEKFNPGNDFKSEIKSISKQTLKLLHEMKGWHND